MGKRSRRSPDYEWFGLAWVGRAADREIRAFLLDRLRENPVTRWQDVRVGVERSEVTLSGAVSSPFARRAAEDDAWATPGVTEVHNHLRVAILAVRWEGPGAA
jgi:osmotically-inducible protein OsmY